MLFKLLMNSICRELMLEMVVYAERVPKVRKGNMWKDSEVLRLVAVQAYFWQANAKYFFAKCVVAILDSQSRKEGWGEIEISTNEGGQQTITSLQR